MFLKLPAEMVDRIDRDNVVGDRSVFITNLLNQQLSNFSTMKTSDFNNKTEENKENAANSTEINISKVNGENIGSFDINTISGFEKLIRKIVEESDDPIVKMRAQRLL